MTMAALQPDLSPALNIAIENDSSLMLEIASLRQQNDEVFKLCEDGDVDVDVNETFQFGKTLLLYAIALQSEPDYIGGLLQLGADVNATDLDGQNALHLLCGYAGVRDDSPECKALAGTYQEFYSNQQPHETKVYAVLQAMRHPYTFVQFLSLDDNQTFNTGCVHLAKTLRTSSTLGLTGLNLSNAGIGQAGAIILGEGMKTMHNPILELYIDNNNVGDIGAIAICEGVGSQGGFRQLGLAKNGIGPKGSEGIARLIASSTSLLILMVQENPLGTAGGKILANALESNDSLSVISIAACDIDDETQALMHDKKPLKALLVSL